MIEVYTDGASRGNPGKAAAGVYAKKNGKELFKLAKFLGVQTNNYAEYKAFILALGKLLELKLEKEKIKVFADSKLLVEQLNGNWKVKNENIKLLFKEAKDLIKRFENIEIYHIPRSRNKMADALANFALDKSS